MQTADAVIIGGGVVGLAVARSLRLRGLRRVTIVERSGLGREASHAAGGMLAPQVEADGPDAFLDLACRSRDSYPDFAAALREETGIDIELERSGTLFVALTEEDERAARHRYEWQTRAGFSVEQLTGTEARRLEPALSEATRYALRFPRDWQVENRRLVAALAAANERLGVGLLTGTEAVSLQIERGRITGVETSAGALGTRAVVMAGGAWASLLTAGDKRLPRIRIEPVRGQMLCFEARPPAAHHVIYSPRGYIVPRLDGRLLAGSTTERAGYDKRVTGDGLRAIMEQALEIAPPVGQLALLESWAGLRPRADDNLPVLGRSSAVDGLFYATGHYRNGILLAPLTGELIARELCDGESPTPFEFSPDRFQPAGVR